MAADRVQATRGVMVVPTAVLFLVAMGAAFRGLRLLGIRSLVVSLALAALTLLGLVGLVWVEGQERRFLRRLQQASDARRDAPALDGKV